MRTVVLYSREGCCLCDHAREVIERVRSRHRFHLLERDVDQDEALQRAYMERIPVVSIDGAEAFELFVEEADLERRLSAPQGPAGGVRDAPGPRPSASRVEPE